MYYPDDELGHTSSKHKQKSKIIMYYNSNTIQDLF